MVPDELQELRADLRRIAAGIRRVKRDLAWQRLIDDGIRVCRLLRQVEMAEAVKYDPNQPRHPAGTSEGGRWSGGGATTGSVSAPGAATAAAAAATQVLGSPDAVSAAARAAAQRARNVALQGQPASTWGRQVPPGFHARSRAPRSMTAPSSRSAARPTTSRRTFASNAPTARWLRRPSQRARTAVASSATPSSQAPAAITRPSTLPSSRLPSTQSRAVAKAQTLGLRQTLKGHHPVALAILSQARQEEAALVRVTATDLIRQAIAT